MAGRGAVQVSDLSRRLTSGWSPFDPTEGSLVLLHPAIQTGRLLGKPDSGPFEVNIVLVASMQSRPVLPSFFVPLVSVHYFIDLEYQGPDRIPQR